MRTRTLSLAAVLFVATPAAAQQTPTLEFAFAETVTLGEAVMVGNTARGERVIIPITGGTFEGPGLKGTIVPGSWDWQLVRADGCRELEADYFLKTDDGVHINVLNRAVICPGENGGRTPVRTYATFEPPLGKYQWLGQGGFVGTLEGGEPGSIRIRFYRVR